MKAYGFIILCLLTVINLCAQQNAPEVGELSLEARSTLIQQLKNISADIDRMCALFNAHQPLNKQEKIEFDRLYQSISFYVFLPDQQAFDLLFSTVKEHDEETRSAAIMCNFWIKLARETTLRGNEKLASLEQCPATIPPPHDAREYEIMQQFARFIELKKLADAAIILLSSSASCC
jgi:hypothetical protein